MLLMQKEDACSKMFILMARWSQLSMTYIMEIARGLNITELLIMLVKTVKKITSIKQLVPRPIQSRLCR